MRTLIKDLSSKMNQEVMIQGWVQRIRNMSNVVFVIVRDRTGRVQTTFTHEIFDQADLTHETVVQLKGTLVPSQNKYAPYELAVSQVEVINRAHVELSIQVNMEDMLLQLDTLLNNRVLALRNKKEAAIFRIQSVLSQSFERFLIERDFLKVHTPKLVKEGTEGGSNLFSLDYFGQKAFLAQSPQFYKQMLVIAGYERVFEIGPVFRAETHHSSRHLNEYVSMDLEIGFIQDEYELMALETDLLRFMIQEVKERCGRDIELLEVELPVIGEQIPRMKLSEALEILRTKHLKTIEELDLNSENERLIGEYIKETTGSDFVFITQYPRDSRPMYTMPGENQETKGFDLIFRGVEITSGGMRIHDYNTLVESIKMKDLDPANYQSYLEAFKFGVPPHGGFAIGLERLTTQLLGFKNIRRSTLFPRDIDRLTP